MYHFIFSGALKFGEWSGWSECSVFLCGGGKKRRFRQCVKGIDACLDDVQEAPCNYEPCPSELL